MTRTLSAKRIGNDDGHGDGDRTRGNTPQEPLNQQGPIIAAARSVHDRLPQAAVRADLTAESIGSAVAVDAYWFDAADNPTQVEFYDDDPLSAILSDLRDAMYTPGCGTWFSVALHITADGQATLDANYEDPPQAFGPILIEALGDELERYPRTPDNFPEWFPHL